MAIATASASSRQTTVASTRVAAEPRLRGAGGVNAGALPGVGGTTTRRTADGTTSGGAGTSPRAPTGAALGGAGGAGGAAGTGRAAVTCGAATTWPMLVAPVSAGARSSHTVLPKRTVSP